MTTAESHECLPIPGIEEKELLSAHWLGSPIGSQYQGHEGSCSTAKRNRWGKYPGFFPQVPSKPSNRGL